MHQERGDEEGNQEQAPMLSETEAEEAARLEDAADEEAPLEDADVATERTRVVNGAAGQDTICLEHLRKVYPGPPPKVACSLLSHPAAAPNVPSCIVACPVA